MSSGEERASFVEALKLLVSGKSKQDLGQHSAEWQTAFMTFLLEIGLTKQNVTFEELSPAMLDAEKAKAALEKLGEEEEGSSSSMEAWEKYAEEVKMLKNGLPFHGILHQMQMLKGRSKEEVKAFEELLAGVGVTGATSLVDVKTKLTPIVESLGASGSPIKVTNKMSPVLAQVGSVSQTEETEEKEDAELAKMVKFRKDLEKASKGIPLNSVLQQMKVVSQMSEEDLQGFLAILESQGLSRTDPPAKVKSVLKPLLVRLKAYMAKRPAAAKKTPQRQQDPVVVVYKMLQDGRSQHSVEDLIKALGKLKKPVDDLILQGMDRMDWSAEDKQKVEAYIKEQDEQVPVLANAPPQLRPFVKAYLVSSRDATKAAAKRAMRRIEGATEELLRQVEEYVQSKGEFVTKDGRKEWQDFAEREEAKESRKKEVTYDAETLKEITALVIRESREEPVVNLAQKGELESIRSQHLIDPFQQYQDNRALLQQLPPLDPPKPRTMDSLLFSTHFLLHHMDPKPSSSSTPPYGFLLELVESLKETLPSAEHQVVSEAAAWREVDAAAASWKARVEAFISHIQSSARNKQPAILPLTCRQSTGVFPFAMVVSKVEKKELFKVTVCSRNSSAGRYHAASVDNGEVKVDPFLSVDNVRAGRLFHAGLVTMLLQLGEGSRAKWNSMKVVYEVVLPFLNEGRPIISQKASTLLLPSFCPTSWVDPTLLSLRCVAYESLGPAKAEALMQEVELTLTESCARQVLKQQLTPTERQWVLHLVARALKDVGQPGRFGAFLSILPAEDSSPAVQRQGSKRKRKMRFDQQKNTAFLDAKDSSALDSAVARAESLRRVYQSNGSAGSIEGFPSQVKLLREAVGGMSTPQAIVNAVAVFVLEVSPSLEDMLKHCDYSSAAQLQVVETVSEVVEEFATAAMALRRAAPKGTKEDTVLNAVVSGYLFCLLWAMLTSSAKEKCRLAQLLAESGEGFSLRGLQGSSFDVCTRLTQCRTARLQLKRAQVLAFEEAREGGIFDIVPLMTAKLKESTPFIDLAVAVSGTGEERLADKVERLTQPADQHFRMLVEVAMTAKYLQVRPPSEYDAMGGEEEDRFAVRWECFRNEDKNDSVAITMRVNGDLALGDFVFLHRKTVSDTRPAAYFLNDSRAKLDDEEDVLYKLQLHTFEQQVSSTEAEELYTIMLFPFLRISGLLRFLNDGRRPLVMDAYILQILEAVLLEPGLVHGQPMTEQPVKLPTSFNSLSTPGGNALLMELCYDADAVMDGLLGLLQYSLKVLSPDSVDKVMRVLKLCASAVGFLKQSGVEVKENKVKQLLLDGGLAAVESMVEKAIAAEDKPTLLLLCKAGLEVLWHMDDQTVEERAVQAMRWALFASSVDDAFHSPLLLSRGCLVPCALSEEDVKELASQVLAFRGYASVEGSEWQRVDSSLLFINGILVFNAITAALDTATASFKPFPKALRGHRDAPSQLTSTCLSLGKNHVEFSPPGQPGVNLRLNLESGMAVEKEEVVVEEGGGSVMFKGRRWAKNAALWEVLHCDAFTREEKGEEEEGEGEAFVAVLAGKSLLARPNVFDNGWDLFEVFTINQGASYIHFPVATTDPLHSAYDVPKLAGQAEAKAESLPAGPVLQVQKITSDTTRYQQVHAWELLEYLPKALLEETTVFREVGGKGSSRVVVEDKRTAAVVMEMEVEGKAKGELKRSDGFSWVPYEQVVASEEIKGAVMQLARFAGGLGRCLFFAQQSGRIDRVELPSFKLSFRLVKDILTNAHSFALEDSESLRLIEEVPTALKPTLTPLKQFLVLQDCETLQFTVLLPFGPVAPSDRSISAHPSSETRVFMYDVVASQSEVEARSRAGALWVCLLLVFAKEYERAYRQCLFHSSALPLSADERFMLEQVPKIEDNHPEATAVRLNILGERMVRAGVSDLPKGWNAKRDLTRYIRSVRLVRPSVRLEAVFLRGIVRFAEKVGSKNVPLKQHALVTSKANKRVEDDELEESLRTADFERAEIRALARRSGNEPLGQEAEIQLNPQHCGGGFHRLQSFAYKNIKMLHGLNWLNDYTKGLDISALAVDDMETVFGQILDAYFLDFSFLFLLRLLNNAVKVEGGSGPLLAQLLLQRVYIQRQSAQGGPLFEAASFDVLAALAFGRSAETETAFTGKNKHLWLKEALPLAKAVSTSPWCQAFCSPILTAPISGRPKQVWLPGEDKRLPPEQGFIPLPKGIDASLLSPNETLPKGLIRSVKAAMKAVKKPKDADASGKKRMAQLQGLSRQESLQAVGFGKDAEQLLSRMQSSFATYNKQAQGRKEIKDLPSSTLRKHLLALRQHITAVQEALLPQLVKRLRDAQWKDPIEAFAYDYSRMNEIHLVQAFASSMFSQVVSERFADAEDVTDAVVSLLLVASNVGHAATIHSHLLQVLRGNESREAAVSGKLGLVSACSTVRSTVRIKSKETQAAALVFEFFSRMVLRPAQCGIVSRFVESSAPMCEQMIMGGGKTSVVAPLLSVLLLNKQSRLTLVVPEALVEMSQQVLRMRFAGPFQRRVQVLTVSRESFSGFRAVEAAEMLAEQVEAAQAEQTVLLASSSSFKAIELCFIEAKLEVEAGGEDKVKVAVLQALRRALYALMGGVVVVDEIDMLLHPLRSELSFPMGTKVLLQAAEWRTRLAQKLVDLVLKEKSLEEQVKRGVEELQMATQPHLHLVNPDFYSANLEPHICKLLAPWILQQVTHREFLLEEATAEALQAKAFASSELSEKFSMAEPLKGLEERVKRDCYWASKERHEGREDEAESWGVGFATPVVVGAVEISFRKLSSFFGKSGLSMVPSKIYLEVSADAGKSFKRVAEAGENLSHKFYLDSSDPIDAIRITMQGGVKWFAIERVKLFTSATGSVQELSESSLSLWLSNEGKLDLSALPVPVTNALLIAKKYLRHVLRHALSKVNDVQYGLILGKLADDESPQRKYMAVPFIGKGVPSPTSEFAHPDTTIFLTLMAYIHAGLRVPDLFRIVRHLQERLRNESGILRNREAYLLFEQWLEGAEERLNVSPLHLFRVENKEEMRRFYEHARFNQDVLHFHLQTFVWPHLKHRSHRITASSEELANLSKRSLGFSGTPTTVLPKAMGELALDERAEGAFLKLLTSNSCVQKVTVLPVHWDVDHLLNTVASSGAHCLIDIGALVTGFTNEEIASKLLEKLNNAEQSGGQPKFLGVVFIEEGSDRKVLLTREGRRLDLAESSIPADRRFTFYDQIHTTGMDIHQAANVMGVVTVNKDMTFRDYAQGSWRMRGLEYTGQKLAVLVSPQVVKLIDDKLALAPQKKKPAQKKKGGAREDASASLLTPFRIVAFLMLNHLESLARQQAQMKKLQIHTGWKKAALFLEPAKIYLDPVDYTETTSSGQGSQAEATVAATLAKVEGFRQVSAKVKKSLFAEIKAAAKAISDSALSNLEVSLDAEQQQQREQEQQVATMRFKDDEAVQAWSGNRLIAEPWTLAALEQNTYHLEDLEFIGAPKMKPLEVDLRFSKNATWKSPENHRLRNIQYCLQLKGAYIVLSLDEAQSFKWAKVSEVADTEVAAATLTHIRKDAKDEVVQFLRFLNSELEFSKEDIENIRRMLQGVSANELYFAIKRHRRRDRQVGVEYITPYLQDLLQ